MKILFVSGRDLKATTSYEMYNIAKKISNKIKCYVLLPNFDEHKLGHKEKYENKNLKIVLASNPVKILYSIKKIKPDIVHLWYSNLYQFTTALFAKLFTHSKIILHVTDYEEFFVFSNINSPISLIKSILKLFVVKLVPSISDNMTILSPNLNKYVLRTKAKRRHLIYTLLPYTQRSYYKLSKECMGNLKPKKKEFWFLCASSISRFQGVEEIISSFLRAKIKGAKLVVIGDGPLKSQLVNEYGNNENLIFVKSLKRKDLFCYYKLADCVLCYFPHNLINELRLPSKLREAMFFGKPIVTTNIGFCKLLSNDSVLKVDFHENDLTNGIRKIYYDKNLRRKFSKNIKEEFKKWFQDSENLDGLIKFYEKTLEN
jgi:glycosyltransferase involved in cell wall biosynthesis